MIEIGPLLIFILILIALSIGMLIGYPFVESREAKNIEARISNAEARASEEPEKAKPAWDVARTHLEAYFNRNHQQGRTIFWVSVVVMLIGFTIIVVGVTIALQSDQVTPENNTFAIVSGIGGIITEFIGATFLFLYRSTMQQAADHIKTLERINTVGMAMQILDTMPDDAKDDNLKNVTKATVVKVLMAHSQENEAEEISE